MATIGQIVISSNNFDTNTDIFEQNKIERVSKLGVNGTPGSKFSLNHKDVSTEALIVLNQYGLYELDITGLGLITSMYIKEIPVGGQIYIDYISE